MNIEETKLLTQVATKMETVIQRMDDFGDKLDDIQKTHIMGMNSRMAVVETKVGRLEKILYGTITLVITEGVALVSQYLNQ